MLHRLRVSGDSGAAIMPFALMILSLIGCAASVEFPPRAVEQAVETSGPQAPAIVQSKEGDRPGVCYVRARSFRGLVPLSCDEAIMVRP